MAFIILLVIIVALVIFAIGNYNKIQGLKNNLDEAQSQIDVQLKRRADLVPNLVETVKGYANFENKTLKDVVKYRNAMLSSSDMQDKMEANKQLSHSLSGIFAVAESYPELKANEGFTNLQEELTNTENKIGYARQLYNSCVNQFNKSISMFPNNILAGMFHFEKAEYLQITREDKKPVHVHF